jgi:hypothetical protein
MSTPYTSPTGRLVWGDPFTAQKVIDDITKQPKRDAAGQEIYEYAFGVAYAKNDPLWPAFFKLLKDADRAAWPQYHDVNGQVLNGVKFADKITDGDGFNTKGKKRASPGNGYEGHWVVKYGSRFAPAIHFWDGRQWVQMTDPKMLKCGDYIQVNGTTASNNSQQSPGMYRNASMVALYRQGVEIVKGPDANEAFGAPPPGTQPPAPPSAPGPMPQAGPPPAPAAPPPTPPAPPVQSTPIMLASANGIPYEQWRAQGWTDEQLIAAGHMAAPVAVTPPAPPPAPAAAPPPPAAPPPAPAAPPPTPPAPVRTMLPAAAGQTYEAMLSAGWTDALLIQHGMMAA